MTTKAKTIEEYLASLPEERKEVMTKLRNVINQNIPKEYKEKIGHGIEWVVPYSLYPDGYHCPPHQELPFLGIASQKNHIGVYHFGMYVDQKLLNWFTSAYPKHAKRNLDIGKSCIRLKKMDDVPYELIGELSSKIAVQEWIEIYEMALKK